MSQRPQRPMKPILRFLKPAPLALFLLLLPASRAPAYYHSAVQRWLNRDPIEERGGPNLYVAMDNDPVMHVDRFGWDGMDPMSDLILAVCKCRAMISAAMHGAENYAIENYSSVSLPHRVAGSTIDMLTHCIGACEIAKGEASCAGSGIDARKFLENYDHNGQGGADYKNDFENDKIGFGIADSGKDCKQGCESALHDGKLWTIEIREGRRVAQPSGPRRPR